MHIRMMRPAPQISRYPFADELARFVENDAAPKLLAALGAVADESATAHRSHQQQLAVLKQRGRVAVTTPGGALPGKALADDIAAVCVGYA